MWLRVGGGYQPLCWELKLAGINCSLPSKPSPGSCKPLDRLQNSKAVTTATSCQCSCNLGEETESWGFLPHHLPSNLSPPVWTLVLQAWRMSFSLDHNLGFSAACPQCQHGTCPLILMMYINSLPSPTSSQGDLLRFKVTLAQNVRHESLT